MKRHKRSSRRVENKRYRVKVNICTALNDAVRNGKKYITEGIMTCIKIIVASERNQIFQRNLLGSLSINEANMRIQSIEI